MVDLDNPQLYLMSGTADMLQHLHDFPAECERAWDCAGRINLPPEYGLVDRVIVCGMGGSAVGGDLVRRLALLERRIPIWLHRDYGLPPMATDTSLLIFSSYSGNTEETLSAFEESTQTSARKLVVSTGGRLEQMASQYQVPIHRIDYNAPPRAAFPHSFVSLLRILDILGTLQVNPRDMQEAFTLAAKLAGTVQENVPLKDNAAKQIAHRLHGRLGVIYGAGLLSEVAQRWKAQLNENSKSWAFSEILPEADHNAVVGYRFPRLVSTRAHAVFLHSPLLSPRVSLRYRLTAELMTQDGVSNEMVNASGKGPVAQMITAVLLGDYVSFYLAVLNEVDPTAVPPIDTLKLRLADSQTNN